MQCNVHKSFHCFHSAHEIKIWVLYYSIPVLKGILPQVYLEHHVRLVAGLSLLLKDTVGEEDIQKAKQLLNRYCSDFANLYGVLILF